jgi:hypothetical protein
MADENDVIQAILDKDEWRARLLTGVPYPEPPKRKEDPGATPEERAAYWLGELRFLFDIGHFDDACAAVKSMDAAHPLPSLDMLRPLHEKYRSADEFARVRAHREDHARVERAFEGAEEELNVLFNRRITEAVRKLKLPAI